jgi:O-antigen/teichoic acid export membrane protein
MIKFFKKGADKIGVNGAITFTILSRIIQAGGGIYTLILIANYLSLVEQGYYYTFGSILAIQVFFELGLNGIITQFVAHENAPLLWDKSKGFIGSKESSSRLASLLRFTLRTFGFLSILLFFGLLFAGYSFFGKYENDDLNIKWQTPWLLLSITTSLSFIVSPILAFLEGLGRVKEVAKMRMIQQMIQLTLVLLFFSLGFKLFSVPIASLIAFTIIPISIFAGTEIVILRDVWKKLDIWRVNYRLEIFPFQWKIAMSWISGYFIFQLFNPILFATEGAVVAGKMGMTLTVLNFILAITFSWITTKVSIFSGMIANKEFDELDTLYNKTLKQSTILNAIILLLFYLIIFTFRYFEIKIAGQNISDRFLDNLPMLFLAITIFFNHIVGSLATYMRCHKKEPLIVQSVVMALLCTLSTIILGHYFGVFGITFGYLILNTMGFIWAYNIYISKKREWHIA